MLLSYMLLSYDPGQRSGFFLPDQRMIPKMPLIVIRKKMIKAIYMPASAIKRSVICQKDISEKG